MMNHFNIPMSSIIPSNQATKPLLVQGLEIATFICYEIAFPELVRMQGDDVGMLLTVSNDAWFGHSIASAQHMAMAQMRAIELAKPILFVSNTGLTSIIKPNGKIQSAIPPYKTAVLTDKVQAMTGQTLWQKRGMDPLLLTIITFLIISIKSQRKTKKKASY
jgi:apolipoprotein N-acyltransferase